MSKPIIVEIPIQNYVHSLQEKYFAETKFSYYVTFTSNA